MAVDLTEFERGASFAGDYPAALSALQDRLAHLQRSQVAHRRRMIVVVEGWVGSGKRDALRQLTASWDPCQVMVRCDPTIQDPDQRQWLAPYWAGLPTPGTTTVYFRSWYRRLIDDRLAGAFKDRDWIRGLDEINEFESQQHDHGTTIVKLFFHVDAATQGERLRARQRDPWLRNLVSLGDVAGLKQREAAVEALEDALAQTDTRWAPWRVIDANDAPAGRITMLEAVAGAMERAMPKEPPAEDDNIVDFRAPRQA